MNVLLLGLWSFCCAVSVAHAEPKRIYAKLLDHTVELQPSKAAFAIPQRWIDLYHNEHLTNLHLDREQLEKVRYAGNAEWDSVYAKIVDAVVPFDNCAFHGGSDGWGNKSSLYTDLQMRVYVGEWPVADIYRTVEVKAVAVAKAICKDSTSQPPVASGPEELLKDSLRRDRIGDWDRLRVALPLFYYDYGGIANVDFYVRSFGHDTVVFVFMYSSGAFETTEIQTIVNSFRHP